MGRNDLEAAERSWSGVLRYEGTLSRPRMGVSSARQREAQVRALEYLHKNGYSTVRYDVLHGTGWKVVNNRSLEEVHSGPLNYADAFKISEELNANVASEALRIARAG